MQLRASTILDSFVLIIVVDHLSDRRCDIGFTVRADRRSLECLLAANS